MKWVQMSFCLQLSCIFLPVFFSLVMPGCGKGLRNPNAVDGTLKLLNGPANANAVSAGVVTDGTWALTPQKMSLTVTGLGFKSADETVSDSYDRIQTLENCTLTYDVSRSTLEELGECLLTVPMGTFEAINISYSSDYRMFLDDSDTGIYSDPSAPFLMTTAIPSQGAGWVSLTNGAPGSSYKTIYFVDPVTFEESSAPEVSLVFDPIHWMTAEIKEGEFEAQPDVSGDPPVYVRVGALGSAAYYSNAPTSQSYGGIGVFFGFVLYSDPEGGLTQLSMRERDTDQCYSTLGIEDVAYASNGIFAGAFGYLGIDEDGIIAWAFPGTITDRGPISNYEAVFSVARIGTLGDSATLSYRCGASVPEPRSGQNYSSGAPVFAADGTLDLVLLAH